MSLLTPPKTSHREEKENRATASGSRVVWSQHNQYHNLSSPPRFPTASSAEKEPPVKSILKKPSIPLLPLENECEQREATPEPSSPLDDQHYLNSPVSQIISKELETKLGELISAYSVLAARIRAHVYDESSSDSQLLEPLKNNRESLLRCIKRDLGRALVDPVADEDHKSARAAILLPSPTRSPKKKRGMTAEQAKFARDLCTLSHSVLKLLGLMFTLPPVYNIFTVAQLQDILTGLLAIPMAEELPTPNARKTYALAICVIQTQRLPPAVLRPAAARIAHALRRGIDGELGKEGKKGAASDGLKAIHDLSIYSPLTFVPVFITLLESVLSNLLAPSLALRVQACHALGGLSLGSLSIPLSDVHTCLSKCVSSFLLTIPAKASPTKLSPTKSSPAKSIVESPICRTLRTTINNEDPGHVAHGPVWALSVLGSFCVLLGSGLYSDVRVSRTIIALVSLTLRHKKSSVRFIGGIAWRALTWAYFQPPLPPSPDGESEVEDDDPPSSPVKTAHTPEQHRKILGAVVGMGVGVSTVAAIVGSETVEGDMRQVFHVLELMMRKGLDSFTDAMQVITQLVSFSPAHKSWNVNDLLPKSFFSAHPGLLTAEFSNLQPYVREIFEECPSLGEIRPLTKEELSRDNVMEELFQLWKRAAYLHEAFEKDVDLLKEGWQALLNAALVVYEDDGEDGKARVAEKAIDIIDHLLYADLECGGEADCSDAQLSFGKLDIQSASARKIKLLHDLWTLARHVVPSDYLDWHAENPLQSLIKWEEEMNKHECHSRGPWAEFCVDLSLSASEGLSMFWDAASKWEWCLQTKSRVWSIFVQKVQADPRGTWDDALLLLTVPYRDQSAWDLSSEDLGIWESFLAFALEKACDAGLEKLTAIDLIAETRFSPSFVSCTRIADMLMAACELGDAEALPDRFIDFLADTLRSSYPPSVEQLQSCKWMMRGLLNMIEHCPKELVLPLFETLQEGLLVWIQDEYAAVDTYEMDILNMYEAVLEIVRGLPETPETLEVLSPLLESVFVGRTNKPQAIFQIFDNFWNSTSYSSVVPSSQWPTKVQEHFNVQIEPELLDDDDILPPSSPPPVDDDDEEPQLADPIEIFSLLPPAILSTPSSTRTQDVPLTPKKTPSAFSLLASPTPTRKRDITTLFSGSPSSPKRRKVGNKENESPCLQLPSPRTRTDVFASPSRKRRLSETDYEPGSGVKRPRLDLCALTASAIDQDQDDAEEDAVEAILLPKRASTGSLVTPPKDKSSAPNKDVFGPLLRPSHSDSVTSSRKRKALTLAAVEVPTLKELKRQQSMPKIQKLDLTHILTSSAAENAVPSTEPKTPSKSYTKSSSSPGFDMPEVAALKSDDSMVMGCGSPKAELPSSDDDPHLGQVTPRHLISPVLRRLSGSKWSSNVEDPPSDDSVGSPTKGVVERRLKMQLQAKAALEM
ncbi:hypothetical protein VNI00_002675 [Paramarasmius palmivorus]|uniref:Telomere-associated protein Rif1 N-terminal domain-containing protein n=1 Tax=Paramarasmius palmivorus TaxID=297713 RepID=A0AAW0DY22_9AGAR